MAVRCMIIVRRHMLIHVDTWWYFLFIRYTFFVVLRYFEKTFCYIVGFFIYWYCPKHADITMLFDDVNLWWFIKQIKGYLILHVIFFSNIVTYYIHVQIYIPTFTPGLQSARETLMVESAQSRRVADIVCLTPGRPHSVTEKSHSNQFLKTCLLHCLHVLLYIHTLLERSKENGHYWSWIFSNSIQLLAHMCMR